MLTEAAAAEESVALTHSEPCGVVRLSCPVALLAARVGPMLAAFMAQHPRVSLQVDETNRRVDVVAEGLDLAIRVRPPPLQDSELVLRQLAERHQCLVASPALLERMGPALGPMDLARWPSLDMGQPQDSHRWVLLGPNQERAEVRHQPRLVTPSMLALRDAALAGVGVVQLPSMFIRAELARGSLVQVLPGWAPRVEVIHAVYASRRGSCPRCGRCWIFWSSSSRPWPRTEAVPAVLWCAAAGVPGARTRPAARPAPRSRRSRARDRCRSAAGGSARSRWCRWPPACATRCPGPPPPRAGPGR